jgi:hypothetical protein
VIRARSIGAPGHEHRTGCRRHGEIASRTRAHGMECSGMERRVKCTGAPLPPDASYSAAVAQMSGASPMRSTAEVPPCPLAPTTATQCQAAVHRAQAQVTIRLVSLDSHPDSAQTRDRTAPEVTCRARGGCGRAGGRSWIPFSPRRAVARRRRKWRSGKPWQARRRRRASRREGECLGVDGDQGFST